MWFKPTEVIGGNRYKILRRIGRGGQGDVYRARCEVVVKRLLRVQDPHHRERMRREFEAARQIDHPNVVKVFEAYFGADPYIVMEYLRGEALSKRIARSRRKGRPLDCVPLLLQAMQGVKELHSKGLIHRDLKPDNIFVRTDCDPERAVVLDLGAVRFMVPSRHHERTTSGMLIGTLPYMAPEQTEGVPATERADVFALGVILYELLAGCAPSDIDRAASACDTWAEAVPHTLAAALEKLERVPAWSSCTQAHDLRVNLSRVVMTAIERDYERRYESVGAFAFPLERAVGLSESTVSAPFTGPQRDFVFGVRQQPRRTRVVSAAAVLVIGAILAAATLITSRINGGHAVRLQRDRPQLVKSQPESVRPPTSEPRVATTFPPDPAATALRDAPMRHSAIDLQTPPRQRPEHTRVRTTGMPSGQVKQPTRASVMPINLARDPVHKSEEDEKKIWERIKQATQRGANSSEPAARSE